MLTKMLLSVLIVPLTLLLLLTLPGTTSNDIEAYWSQGGERVQIVYVWGPGGDVDVRLKHDQPNVSVNVSISHGDPEPAIPINYNLVHLTCIWKENGSCSNFPMAGRREYTVRMRFSRDTLFPSVIGNVTAQLVVKAVAEPAVNLGLPPLPVVIVDTRSKLGN